MERLRQLVGSKGWDYCVLWRFNEDLRSPYSRLFHLGVNELKSRILEWIECCCGGAESSESNGGVGEEELFPVMQCRDVTVHHPRSLPCDLLALLPSSLPLDGTNAEMVFLSNQPKWINFSKSSDSSISEETVGTKVLIPIPGGLVELFVSKQVPEDHNVIDYVISQCNILLDQDNHNHNHNRMKINGQQAPLSPATALEHLNLSYDATTPDPTRSPMDFLHHFNYMPDGSNDPFAPPDSLPQQPPPQLTSFRSMSENGFEELMNNATSCMHESLHSILDNSAADQEKGGLVKQERGPADSGSDSDLHLDDDDDPKYRRSRPSAKGPQSKNLVAERRRRKKLNERLYNLRSLVPKISKLDRASILGDAIEYVKELQQQAKDLQTELEVDSDGDNHNNNNFQTEFPLQFGSGFGPDFDPEPGLGGFYTVGSSSNGQSLDDPKRGLDSEGANEKAQQMEVQVEVAPLQGNEVYIKVFGEQRRGRFVRLMEALTSLGLDISTVTVTTHMQLVSFVFTVEKRDSESVQAEYLRESLLEATRNQASGGLWSEIVKASSENGGIASAMDHHQHHNCAHHHHNHHADAHHHFHHFNN